MYIININNVVCIILYKQQVVSHLDDEVNSPYKIRVPATNIRTAPLMSQFLTTLVARHATPQESNTRFGVWYLEKELRYRSDILGRVVVVPVGFVTDFASVPRYLPFAYALFGSTANASAVIHDYLVRRSALSWKEAAEVFLEAMETEGIVWWKRKLMYWGVRLAGLTED